MPALLPTLRSRAKKPVASARKVGLSVPKASTVTGMNTIPVPRPCTKPVVAMARQSMFRAKWLIDQKETANTPRPLMIRARGSTRLMIRPTTNIERMLPMPRGARTIPVVRTG